MMGVSRGKVKFLNPPPETLRFAGRGFEAFMTPAIAPKVKFICSPPQLVWGVGGLFGCFFGVLFPISTKRLTLERLKALQKTPCGYFQGQGR
jgi:hypothetical protein